MKKEKVNIKLNYIYNVIYQALALIVPLITTPIVARALTAEGVGIYSYTHSIDTYFTIFGNLGLANYGQLKIAAYRDNRNEMSREFWNILGARSITLFFSIVVYTFFIIKSQGCYRIMYIINSINIIASIIDISWFFQGIELFKKTVVKNSIVKLLSVVLIVFLVKDKSGLYIYALILAGSVLFGNVTLWLNLKKYIDKPQFEIKNIINHIKCSIPYFVPTIASSLYTVLDKTMIGVITKSAQHNGYYEQANKIIKIFTATITALGNVTLPRMTYYYKNNENEKITKLFEKSLLFVLFTTIPLTIGIIIVSSNLVVWFLGDNYEYCVMLIILLSPTIISTCLSNLLNFQILMPQGMQNKLNISVIVGAILNVILNVILIFQFDSAGACIASSFAQLIILLMAMYFCKKYISIKKLFIYSYKYIIAATVMGIVLFFTRTLYKANFLGLLLEMFIGILVYILLLLVLKDKYIYNFINTQKDRKSRHEK